jgi:hypothetical protein
VAASVLVRAIVFDDLRVDHPAVSRLLDALAPIAEAELAHEQDLEDRYASRWDEEEKPEFPELDGPVFLTEALGNHRLEVPCDQVSATRGDHASWSGDTTVGLADNIRSVAAKMRRLSAQKCGDCRRRYAEIVEDADEPTRSAWPQSHQKLQNAAPSQLRVPARSAGTPPEFLPQATVGVPDAEALHDGLRHQPLLRRLIVGLRARP